MPQRNMVDAIGQALAVELAQNPDTLVFGEDVGKNGGVFRVTDGLQARFGEARVFDTPISEAGIIGMACGMCAAGLVPIPEIQFMGFTLPAVNQLVGQAARMHTRSGGRYRMQMTVRMPYSGLVRSPELHSDSFEALFLHSPGLKVVIPSTPTEAKGLLHAAVADPDPVLFLEPMKLYRAFREAVDDEAYTIPLGRARTVRPGRDVTLIGWGALVATLVEAAETAAQRGVEAEVLDLRTLRPLDTDAIAASVERTGRAVVVHEAVGCAGFGAEIMAVINETVFYSLLSPVIRVTGWDVPFPLPVLEEYYVPDAGRILTAIERVMME